MPESRKGGQSCAPYNFVPFSEKVLVRYGELRELPPFEAPDPTLCSGEIHVTLTARTPVFVSDGNREAPRFFRDGEGAFCIPGSTVRGMARENMQILGFGLIRPGKEMEDQRLFFREISAARESVRYALKMRYHSALGVETYKTPEGGTVSIPSGVCSGYLVKKGKRYEIRPTAGPYLLVSRRHPGAAALGNEPARAVPVAYTASDGQVHRLVPAAEIQPGMETGTLLFTGNPTGKPNHLYLFPCADPDAREEEISPEDALAYAEDWNARKNSLKTCYDPAFWALPEKGEEKPVFYLRSEGHLYFGMSLFLRLGYRHTLASGLPPRHRQLWESGQLCLDYPYAVLGFAGDVSCRSRVSFGDFTALGDPAELEPVRMVLGQPRPSWYSGYTVGGKNYDDDDFRLRGRKQYWHKEPQTPPPPKTAMAVTLRPLGAGTEFQGIVRFRDLHEDELGLLLWALRLDEGCFQSLGMGKPYGYGRISVRIEQLLELDWKNLYRSFDGGLRPAPEGAAERYIAAYDRFAAERLHLKTPRECPSVRSCPEIQDFLFLRRAIRPAEETRYLCLEEFRNLSNPLPCAAEIRAGETPAAPSAEMGPEALRAALLAKYGPKHKK